MNTKFKKIISLSVACLIGLFSMSCVKTHAGALGDIKNMINSFRGSDNQSEESFNFIKSNESSGDFLYDGSLFLYGGIALISISIIGIIITLKPKRKKKKSTHKVHKKSKKEI